MAKFRDFTFDPGIYGRATEVTDSSAFILAIRNILLTRKGNYPFNPSLGMNIEKYQFDLLDDIQLNEIKSELTRQISTYLPPFQDIQVDVRKIDNVEGVDSDNREMVGISIISKVNSQTLSSSFLLYRKNGTLNIINETN
jgi:phage baseplate assembly protein W